jgi:hypothetical protein
MSRRLRGRSLLSLVLALAVATLAAPPSAPAQARLVPPPVLRTPASVGTAPVSQGMRPPLLRCRRVRRLVVSVGTLSTTQRWVWECRVAAGLRLDWPRVRGCASRLPSPGWAGMRHTWPRYPFHQCGNTRLSSALQ